MPAHDPYTALRHRGFRRYLCVHASFIIANKMQETALGWLLYERTGSAAVLGIIGLMQFLPMLLLAIPVGHLVDRYARRTMVLLGFSILALVTTAIILILQWNVSTNLLLGSLLFIGIGNAFISIARPSMLRDIVPESIVENTSVWSSVARQAASIVGPALAGLLIALSGGASVALIVDTGFLLLAILGTLSITVARSTPHHREPVTVRSVFEGIAFIRRTPLVLSATLLDMFAVLLGGATGLLPLFARDILHVGPVGLGWLIAAPAIGSGIAGFVQAHRPPFTKAGRTLLWSVTGFGLATILFGVSHNPLLSFAALLLTGAFDGISVAVRSTILQLFVPDRVRGRVFGVNMIFVYSSNELGDFESGITAAAVGPLLSVVGGGLAAMCVAGIFAWHWPQLRTLGKLRPEAVPVGGSTKDVPA